MQTLWNKFVSLLLLLLQLKLFSLVIQKLFFFTLKMFQLILTFIICLSLGPLKFKYWKIIVFFLYIGAIKLKTTTTTTQFNNWFNFYNKVNLPNLKILTCVWQLSSSSSYSSSRELREKYLVCVCVCINGSEWLLLHTLLLLLLLLLWGRESWIIYSGVCAFSSHQQAQRRFVCIWSSYIRVTSNVYKKYYLLFCCR